MNNKNILLILVVVVLLLVIIVGVAIFMISTRTPVSGEETVKLNKNIVMYSFDDPFISNVKESRRILKTVIEIELENNKIEKLILAREPEIINEINLILRSKTEQDLEGSEGQEKLQNQILNSIKKVIKTEKILNIYFREFVIQ